MCRQRALRRIAIRWSIGVRIGVICAAKGHCDAVCIKLLLSSKEIGVICAAKGHCDP